jgi:ADP-ribose pyrophosphatase YjhB (NUDIX family)
MYKVFIDNVPQEYDLEKEHLLLDNFSDHEFVRAAGGLVKGKDGFLFIKRHGLWDIPKGKLEEGEAPTRGAIREVEEECGVIEPLIATHLCDTWHTYELNGRKVLKKTYWYAMLDMHPEAELKPQAEEGITELKWFRTDEFVEVKRNTYLSIIDVLDRLLEVIPKS